VSETAAENAAPRTHRLNTCAQCRDWGKYERHEDHATVAIQSEPIALVWVPGGERRADTIHRAGCAHLNLTSDPNPLVALTVEDARAEIADAMGWEDYPEDESGSGFAIDAAPCTAMVADVSGASARMAP
jgi:hypothetical protein